eukprot:s3485_g6.t1
MLRLLAPHQFFEWLAPKAKVACQCQTPKWSILAYPNSLSGLRQRRKLRVCEMSELERGRQLTFLSFASQVSKCVKI